MRQIGPSALPWRGQVKREVQGVRMVPMKTSPASVACGGATATSFSRISFSRTMTKSLLKLIDHAPRHCERSEAIQGRQNSTSPWIASSLCSSQ
jgi:hypothetical protein